MDRDMKRRICKYEHYKGKRYKVLYISENTETGKLLMNYRALYGTRKERKKIWSRPYDMFHEWNNFNGKKQYRFQRIVPIREKIWQRFGELLYSFCCMIDRILNH